MADSAPASSAIVNCYWYHLNRVDEHAVRELASVYLSTDELERAQRFKALNSKHLYMAGRILLRFILANRLGMDAPEVPIQISPKGKPFLAGLDRPFYFNISHSDQVLLVALTDHGELGVDVEADRERINTQSLAERVLSAAELQTFNAMSSTQKRPAFFRYWVLKESFVKMKGDGISYGLDKIHFDEQRGLLLAPKDSSTSLFLRAPERHYAALCLDRSQSQTIELRSSQVHSLSEYLNDPDASTVSREKYCIPKMC